MIAVISLNEKHFRSWVEQNGNPENTYYRVLIVLDLLGKSFTEVIETPCVYMIPELDLIRKEIKNKM